MAIGDLPIGGLDLMLLLESLGPVDASTEDLYLKDVDQSWLTEASPPVFPRGAM